MHPPKKLSREENMEVGTSSHNSLCYAISSNVLIPDCMAYIIGAWLVLHYYVSSFLVITQCFLHSLFFPCNYTITFDRLTEVGWSGN